MSFWILFVFVGVCERYNLLCVCDSLVWGYVFSFSSISAYSQLVGDNTVRCCLCPLFAWLLCLICSVYWPNFIFVEQISGSYSTRSLSWLLILISMYTMYTYSLTHPSSQTCTNIRTRPSPQKSRTTSLIWMSSTFRVQGGILVIRQRRWWHDHYEGIGDCDAFTWAEPYWGWASGYD